MGHTPRIAVAGMWSSQVHGLRREGNAVASAVLEAIVAAGGEPLTLFAQSQMTTRERLAGMDAVVVPGGYDIDPRRYGQEAHPSVVLADHPSQDDFDAEITDAAVALGIPTLLICRGFQMLNVLHGGTMVQDLPGDSVHRNDTHSLSIEAGSQLGEVLGTLQTSVSSYHHQAIDRLGEGLRAVAHGPGDVIEAIEIPGSPVLAVQWHPEDTAHHDIQQAAMFQWLIESAKRVKEDA